MKNSIAQRLLLVSYGVVTLIMTFGVYFEISLFAGAISSDVWLILAVIVIVYLPFQLFSYIHMKNCYKIVHFQSRCTWIDLIALAIYAYAARGMGERTALIACCMLYVAAQRIIQLLVVLRKYDSD